MRVYERAGEQRELWLEGSVVCVREQGQVEREAHELELAAKWALDRRAHAWLSEGFERVDGDEQPELDDDDFMAALRAAPDELANYQVYGDWLSAQGDARGQLIALHCAVAALPRFGAGEQRDRFARQEVALMFQHASSLWGRLGEIVDEPTQTFGFNLIDAQWRWGFVQRARVRELRGGMISYAELLRTLASLPIAALLEELELNQRGYLPEAIRALAEGPWPQLHTLRVCRPYNTLRPRPWEDTKPATRLDAESLAGLLEEDCAPQLRSLRIEGFAHSLSLAEALVRSPITPKLRELELIAHDFDEVFIETLRRAPFEALELLHLEGSELSEAAGEALRGLPGKLRLRPWRDELDMYY